MVNETEKLRNLQISEQNRADFELRVKDWVIYIEGVIELLKDIKSKNCLNCNDYKNGIKELLYAGVGGLRPDNYCSGCIRKPINLLHLLCGLDYHKPKKQEQIEKKTIKTHKELTSDELFNLWNNFCNEIKFTPLTSQHCYISKLFMDGMVEGLDRGTGKTMMSVYLIVFNEKYKLWKIKYVSNAQIYIKRTKDFIKEIYKSKITECEFVSVGQKKDIVSTMDIIDTNEFLITIKDD